MTCRAIPLLVLSCFNGAVYASAPYELGVLLLEGPLRSRTGEVGPVVVWAVDPTSQAGIAGLKPLDQIVAAGGVRLQSRQELLGAWRNLPAERCLLLTVRRSGSDLQLCPRKVPFSSDAWALQSRALTETPVIEIAEGDVVMNYDAREFTKSEVLAKIQSPACIAKLKSIFSPEGCISPAEFLARSELGTWRIELTKTPR